jgi:GH15 family glucan-1,4-alpha-glucosidase
MMVGLDKDGFVHDFYYPYVGLENHASSRDLHHKIGIWIDGAFTWLDDGTWDITMDYEETGLIGVTKAVCSQLDIALEFHDFVDSELNVFARNIHIVNQANQQRDIRLFMHQVFRVSDSNRDDTVAYLPSHNLLMHYRGRRVFFIYGLQPETNAPFDQYSTGVHGIEGKAGTHKDAEDGVLSCNPVEHGRVDSTMRFSLTIPAHSSQRVHYWVVSAANQADALKTHKQMLRDGLNERIAQTRSWWNDWFSTAANSLHGIDREFLRSTQQSLLLMKSHIDKRGAVIASGDSDMLNYARDYYSYCWPRDAAYVLWPLIRLGYTEEARSFFSFCRDVISADGYLRHKYQPDRALGSSWHPYLYDGREELPIQEDETAIVIFLIGEYLKHTDDEDFVRSLYPTLIQPAAQFMQDYIDSDTKLPHASYDLWEERFLTTTYTTSLVYASLLTAAHLADLFEYPDDAIRWRAVAEDMQAAARETFFNHDKGYFHKGYIIKHNGMMEFDTTIDASSLYGAVMFGLYDADDPYVLDSVQTLEDTLLDYSPTKGLPRYENDYYHRIDDSSLGNPWFVTTFWYAQYLNENGNTEKAKEYLHWAKNRMLKSGVLPEQIHPETGKHMSVAPLIWSQAEYVNTVLDIFGKNKPNEQ